MAVRLVVAVTDRDWFENLRSRPTLTEVNFWAPSATNFKALESGELFLFKLHSPQNFIVGGGVFAYSNTLPCSLAWEAFREANGAETLSEMRTRIARYKRDEQEIKGDFQIGCRILTQPFFLEDNEWIPVPTSWSPNIVTFKTYSTDDSDGQALWDRVQNKILTTGSGFSDVGEQGERFGAPMLVRPRLGQGAFRIVVTDAYERRCAITRERTLPALEAAHIRPYSEGGSHEPTNGLLLRRDIHSLFDAGYVTVTPKLQFEVSRRIKEEFENGRAYYALHGQSVSAPSKSNCRPDEAALSWHNDNRYLG